MPLFLLLATPIYYSIELASQCSGNCLPCSNVFGRLCPPLPIESWRQILERVSLHAKTFKLTGGEPTLHPEFEEIIRAVDDLDVSATVFTNGRWQKPKNIVELFTNLSSSKWGLLVSLHGPNAETHEAFTNSPGSFEETCSNIKLATDAGLHVHISTVIIRQNYDRLPEMAELSRSLGAKRAVFNRYLGIAMPSIEPDNEQLLRAVSDIERLRQAGEAVRYGNCIPQCFTPSSSTGCWAGVAYCTIDPWGNLRPCNHSPTIAGNILEQSIEEIWQNDIMNRWRKLTPSQCSHCSEMDVCHGGCKALVEIRGNDPLIGQPIRQVESNSPLALELYEKGRPALNCKILPEKFGYALVRGQAIVPVTLDAKNILDCLDGRSTLQDLQDKLGQDALDFVGYLYVNGMISIEN